MDLAAVKYANLEHYALMQERRGDDAEAQLVSSHHGLYAFAMTSR
jgi:hypothetical protein